MSTQGGGSSSGSGSNSGAGAGAEPISEQLWEFISSEISRSILKILNEHVGAFRAEIMYVVRAHTLSF